MGRMPEKVVIITGGAGGIGRAAGLLFCREGAKVLLVDREEGALRVAASTIRGAVEGAQVETFVGDVASFADAERAVALAVERFGGLDSLVCNAAIRDHQLVEQAGAQDWERLFHTNVLGTASFCKAALKALRQSRDASIVIVSSCYAVAGRKGMPIYDATKAALLSLTRSLAFEAAESRIRVNAVCPGGTLTPFTVGRGIARGTNETAMRAERRSDSLLGRWAEPEEIAYPILWLASSEGSYITGTTLMVDAGLHIM